MALRFVEEPEAIVDDPLLEKRSKNYLPSVKKYHIHITFHNHAKIRKMSEYNVSQCNFLAIIMLESCNSITCYAVWYIK